MTPVFLQKALKNELEELFSDFCSCGSACNRTEQLHIYEQELPLQVATGEAENDPTPYIIIRMMEGEQETAEDTEKVTLFLVICTRDSDLQRTGYQDCMNIMQKIKERFLKNPQLDAYFTAELPLKWMLQEEDTYDAFIGGMELRFACPAIRRESSFA